MEYEKSCTATGGAVAVSWDAPGALSNFSFIIITFPTPVNSRKLTARRPLMTISKIMAQQSAAGHCRCGGFPSGGGIC